MSKHGLETPPRNSVQTLQPEASTQPRRGAGSYPISRTDLPTHTASPVSCTPFAQPLHQDTDVPQHSLNEKCQQIDPARRWARHHPFGEGYGHTDTTLELAPEGQHGVQCLTSQKLQMQTMHPTSNREVKPSHQAGTLHTKTVTLNQPHHIMPLAARFHPMGGSFTHKPQEEYDCEKGPYNTQDAHTAEDTPTTTPEQSHGELTQWNRRVPGPSTLDRTPKWAPLHAIGH